MDDYFSCHFCYIIVILLIRARLLFLVCFNIDLIIIVIDWETAKVFQYRSVI